MLVDWWSRERWKNQIVSRILQLYRYKSCLSLRTHRAPVTPLRAVSRETVGEGGGGALLGSAIGALFPAFWRFASEAILMQEKTQV
jgi:hypothetical protein